MNRHRIVPIASIGLFATVIICGTASAVPMRDGPALPKGQYSTYLQSVDAVSPSDVWAVGYRHPPCCGGEEGTLIKHFDGEAWRTIPSLSVPGRLWSVAAVSSDDVWAVGDDQPSGGEYNEALVLHWDGTAWSKVETPTYPSSSFLTRVSFTSPTNVVARGYWYSGGESVSPVCLVWHGSSWKECPGALAPVVSMDALSGTDAWRVGYVAPDGAQEHTYAAHWDGQTWKKTSTPDAGALTSVTAISANDVWAAGLRPLNPAGFFEHWDGASWTTISDPHDGEFDQITGISGTALDDVWASVTGEPHGSKGYLMHWDGVSWTDVANPGTPRLQSQMTDVVAISRTDAWAVGFYDSVHTPWPSHKILMHWDGTTWSANTH